MTQQIRGETSTKKLIEAFIQENRLDMNVAIPGVIQSFNPATQTATVKISIKKKLIDGRIMKPIELREVPVQQFNAGGFSITLPIKPEDGCLLIFAQRDISDWQKKGGFALPTSDRSFDVSDAIAIIGLNSEKKAIPSYNTDQLEIRNTSTTATIQVSSDGKITMNADAGLEINADVTINGNTTQTGTITATGIINSDSDVTADGISLVNHTHQAGSLLDSGGNACTGQTAASQ